MNTTINICGKNRPIQVNYSVFYDYEVMTGRTAQADAVYFSSAHFSISKFSDFVYCALAAPVREANAIIDFTPRDVAQWVMSDPASLATLGKVIGDAFGVPGEVEESEGEKKNPAVAVGNP